jgi:hypothetical protein
MAALTSLQTLTLLEQPRKGAPQKGLTTLPDNLTVRHNDMLGTFCDQFTNLGPRACTVAETDPVIDGRITPPLNHFRKPRDRVADITRGKGYYHSLFHVTRGHAQLIH